tara:strand:- start:2017 stop:2487 length:471 start_codon:yes stop_codon:yes gene_type:complete
VLTPRKTSIYSATLNNTVVIEMAKKYIPNEKEKYMCAKHKAYFKQRLIQWRNEIIESNNKSLFLNEVDHEISSPDIIDQATSQTEKTVEMRTVNRQRKLLSKIDKAIKRIQDNTYGYCEETGEPIGIKRLIARPIATLSIDAQEKHEKNEKIFADI